MHTFVVYVENKPGVLNRVASLFRRRAFNIESLTVGPHRDAGLSRMTIVVDTDERGARRVEANLYKLVQRAARRQHHARADGRPRPGADQGGRRRPRRARRSCSWSTSSAPASSTSRPSRWSSRSTGTEDKIDGLLEVLRPYGVLEMVADRPRGDGARRAHGRRPSRTASPTPTSTADGGVVGLSTVDDRP